MSPTDLKIKTAVIPAAGLATRFLPVTKTVMKGMIPILDKPMIQYIVEEAIASGVEDIIFVTSPGQIDLENYFRPAPDLEATLRARGKNDLAEVVHRVGSMARVRTVIQDAPKGLGHAVLCAEKFIHGPFAVLLPDEILVSAKPALSQVIAAFESEGGTQSAVAVVEVPRAEVYRYGVVSGRARQNGWIDIDGVVEKPTPETAPSNWVLPGRYIFTKGIFEALKAATPAGPGEWQLTDGIEALAKIEGVIAVPVVGRRFDTGNPLGYFETTVAMALSRPEMAKQARALLEKILGEKSQ